MEVEKFKQRRFRALIIADYLTDIYFKLSEASFKLIDSDNILSRMKCRRVLYNFQQFFQLVGLQDFVLMLLFDVTIIIGPKGYQPYQFLFHQNFFLCSFYERLFCYLVCDSLVSSLQVIHMRWLFPYSNGSRDDEVNICVTVVHQYGLSFYLFRLPSAQYWYQKHRQCYAVSHDIIDYSLPFSANNYQFNT